MILARKASQNLVPTNSAIHLFGVSLGKPALFALSQEAALVTDRNRCVLRGNAEHDAWNYTNGCPTGRFPDIRARTIVFRSGPYSRL